MQQCSNAAMQLSLRPHATTRSLVNTTVCSRWEPSPPDARDIPKCASAAAVAPGQGWPGAMSGKDQQRRRLPACRLGPGTVAATEAASDEGQAGVGSTLTTPHPHPPVLSCMTGCCSTGLLQKPAPRTRCRAASCRGTARYSGGRQPTTAHPRKAMRVDSQRLNVSTSQFMWAACTKMAGGWGGVGLGWVGWGGVG